MAFKLEKVTNKFIRENKTTSKSSENKNKFLEKNKNELNDNEKENLKDLVKKQPLLFSTLNSFKNGFVDADKTSKNTKKLKILNKKDKINSDSFQNPVFKDTHECGASNNFYSFNLKPEQVYSNEEPGINTFQSRILSTHPPTSLVAHNNSNNGNYTCPNYSQYNNNTSSCNYMSDNYSQYYNIGFDQRPFYTFPQSKQLTPHPPFQVQNNNLPYQSQHNNFQFQRQNNVPSFQSENSNLPFQRQDSVSSSTRKHSTSSLDSSNSSSLFEDSSDDCDAIDTDDHYDQLIDLDNNYEQTNNKVIKLKKFTRRHHLINSKLNNDNHLVLDKSSEVITRKDNKLNQVSLIYIETAYTGLD